MRPFIKISEVYEGCSIEVDGDFSCCREGEVFLVEEDEDGFFFRCSEGLHYIDGQIEGDYYVGLYKVVQ